MSANHVRLLSVVKGDWSPYQTKQVITPWLAPPGGENASIELVTTDFNLLRHDIHVVLHEATSR